MSVKENRANLCHVMGPQQNMVLLSLLLILQFRFSTPTDTIAINQTFWDGDILISEGRKFAMGFFSPGSSRQRYVGIWYYGVPEQTVVWVANRNNPINDTSGILAVNNNGNLILYSDRDQQFPVWSASDLVGATAGCRTCAAQLLDSGNLVLVQDAGKRIVWQSFDFPTNTLLHGMKFGRNRKSGQEWYLSSWRSANDPGMGQYSYKLVADGSPQLVLFRDGKHRCRRPWPWRRQKELYNYSFVHNQDETYVINHYLHGNDSVLVRIMLDDSGFLKRLTWHESESQWKEYWAIPKDRCDIYGHCGAYSMCDRNKVETFECVCLPGYEPRFRRDWYLRDGSGGCVGKRQGSSSICGHGEGFVKVVGVKIPDTSAASWVSMNMDRSGCEHECLRNCSCTAYASLEVEGKETACLAWYGELMDAINYMSDGYDIYVRVDAAELAERARQSFHFLQLNGMLAILVLCVVSAWSVLTLLACFWLNRRQRKRRTVKSEGSRSLTDPAVPGSNFYREDFVVNELKESRPPTEFTFFELRTISAATNHFSSDNILGQGGFGVVYKVESLCNASKAQWLLGQLPGGHEIAVKRLAKDSGQGVREFTNEVSLIAKLQHRNLVKLLGCCIQGKEQMLIYEYLPNKSLDSFILDETRRAMLDWRKRFDIIIGIARGILYLHQDSRLRIIHRDLKTSNILLDAEMNPKISDFGMARIYEGDNVQCKTKTVVGTYGYMSPEYAVFGKFSVKSDVFSFGVILLEIISGKKSNCFCEGGSFMSLIGYVWELWKQDKALEMVDSTLDESYVSDEILRCIQIGLLCVQEEAEDRPTMLAVVLMLNSEIALPSLKRPAYIFRTPNNHALHMDERPCSINELTFSGALAR